MDNTNYHVALALIDRARLTYKASPFASIETVDFWTQSSTLLSSRWHEYDRPDRTFEKRSY